MGLEVPRRSVDENDERRRTGCRHQTSLIAGTVMHGTHLPLRKWYWRRQPKRPALPPRRPGEERNTRRYIHPPSLSPEDIAKGYLRHIPIGSTIANPRRRKADSKEHAALLASLG